MLVDEKVGGSTFSNRTSLACSLCSRARSFLVRVSQALSTYSQACRGRTAPHNAGLANAQVGKADKEEGVRAHEEQRVKKRERAGKMREKPGTVLQGRDGAAVHADLQGGRVKTRLDWLRRARARRNAPVHGPERACRLSIVLLRRDAVSRGRSALVEEPTRLGERVPRKVGRRAGGTGPVRLSRRRRRQEEVVHEGDRGLRAGRRRELRSLEVRARRKRERRRTRSAGVVILPVCKRCSSWRSRRLNSERC